MTMTGSAFSGALQGTLVHTFVAGDSASTFTIDLHPATNDSLSVLSDGPVTLPYNQDLTFAHAMQRQRYHITVGVGDNVRAVYTSTVGSVAVLEVFDSTATSLFSAICDSGGQAYDFTATGTDYVVQLTSAAAGTGSIAIADTPPGTGPGGGGGTALVSVDVNLVAGVKQSFPFSADASKSYYYLWEKG